MNIKTLFEKSPSLWSALFGGFLTVAFYLVLSRAPTPSVTPSDCGIPEHAGLSFHCNTIVASGDVDSFAFMADADVDAESSDLVAISVTAYWILKPEQLEQQDIPKLPRDWLEKLKADGVDIAYFGTGNGGWVLSNQFQKFSWEPHPNPPPSIAE